MNLSCQSIKNDVKEILMKEKGSKFIGFAFSVENEDEINAKLLELKEIYPDATHHCYAYRLGFDGEIYRANDDGEPSGSAGIPIYNQIRSAELTYTLVVIIRYFGGTKLGVGGLIQAYKKAAELTLAEAEKISFIQKEKYFIRFEYAQQNEVQKILESLNAEITQQNFIDLVEFHFEVPKNKELMQRNAFEEIQHLIDLKKI
ncbi:IMPACT family member yigZ [Candidatus Ornithobacterium hominis]|uniref:IMPACT family member yigZ n=1 Tax=Candidatus Ornithobacterium hominis TaxID=2497989 RepID=A0A383TZ50_9FLAO|nr:YigZ family protein [Candidatus Ornithobacterium hominis]MCT7904279.1 YigZ family protein [Candidatus Ornithobacterium hominis]SZD72942.1 IMPACT family member yigZ [Candidatus Ornithobacterium hominis]SZD73149.1 IMPACT family member yigZ [Candidatus Ornithobacterium hominis]